MTKSHLTTRLAAFVLAMVCLPLLAVSTAEAQYQGLFDVEARRAQLQGEQFAVIREACLSWDIDPKWLEAPVVDGLRTTSGYGSDNGAQDFSWALMILASRSLAGDSEAQSMLVALLRKWAQGGAFDDTEEVHDAYYALKRSLLPTLVAFGVVREQMEDTDRALVHAWLDRNVRRIDRLFYGEVDINNHRYLADSVLALWGGMIGDEALSEKGVDRFRSILEDARWDGSLPLETRRGSRASWYMRQSLASLVVIAEVGRGQNKDLYALKSTAASIEDGSTQGFWTIMSFWLNAMLSEPLRNAYAAANYIPGPEPDYRKQDYSYWDMRGHDRHYLAFLEVVPTIGSPGLTGRRAKAFLKREVVEERPLIDEFIGGNATCFWGQPK
ncbi:alginate lyase family protein [Roseibium sp.]|uniref:alginate lyase family protein n=1 Tax=Roseibium sp. TaxID=1936156 RepID=UPI003A97F8A7